MNSNTGADVKSTSNTPIYNNVVFFKIFTAISALVLSLAGGAAFIFDFDISNMYFSYSPLTYVFFASVVCVIAAIGILSAISSKGRIYPNTYRAGTWLGAYAAIDLISFLVLIITDFIIRPIKASPAADIAGIIFKGILLICICLLSMVYFVGQFKKSPVANTVLGIIAAAWCVSAIGITYFDGKVAINSPYEIICQFGLAFALLFIICELRFSLGSEKYGMYKFFGGISFCLNLLACVASMILALKGLVELPLYSVPASAMAIYSAKIFFARKAPLAMASVPESAEISESIEISENSDDSGNIENGNNSILPDNSQERTPTDENIN